MIKTQWMRTLSFAVVLSLTAATGTTAEATGLPPTSQASQDETPAITGAGKINSTTDQEKNWDLFHQLNFYHVI